jgi:hypothetical protein
MKGEIVNKIPMVLLITVVTVKLLMRKGKDDKAENNMKLELIFEATVTNGPHSVLEVLPGT